MAADGAGPTPDGGAPDRRTVRGGVLFASATRRRSYSILALWRNVINIEWGETCASRSYKCR